MCCSRWEGGLATVVMRLQTCRAFAKPLQRNTMAKQKSQKPAELETQGVVDAIKTVQSMSGKRARFALTALLVGEHIPLDAFARVCKMADHPTPIEESNAKAGPVWHSPVSN